ncbi:MAG: hypothetical protein ACYCPS_05605, partial [Candidatus Saccharimonadales bacterium]
PDVRLLRPGQSLQPPQTTACAEGVVCPEAGKRPPELQNQPAGASLSVMFSAIQSADRRLPIAAVQSATCAEAP